MAGAARRWWCLGADEHPNGAPRAAALGHGARRAAEAGDAEVGIVDRPIEVVREVTVEANPRSVEEWSTMVRRLALRVDDGRVYDRDVTQLLASVEELSGAIHRRAKRRGLRQWR